MTKLNVVLVGYGAMGRNHARVISTLESFCLKAVVDSDPRIDAPTGVELYKRVEELDLAGVDAAVVCSPSMTHEELGVFFLTNGVHLLVEKPVALTLEGAKRLIAARDSTGVVGMVGHLERFNPAIIRLKNWLDSGRLGSLYQISTRRQGPFPGRITDTGVAKDLAVHDIDIVRFATGQEYAKVFSASTKRVSQPHEESILVMGTLANGTLVHNSANWLSPKKERVVEVVGEKGVAVANTVAGTFSVYETQNKFVSPGGPMIFADSSFGNVRKFSGPKVEPLSKELQRFRQAISGLSREYPTLEDGLSALGVVSAALQSADSQEAIFI